MNLWQHSTFDIIDIYPILDHTFEVHTRVDGCRIDNTMARLVVDRVVVEEVELLAMCHKVIGAIGRHLLVNLVLYGKFGACSNLLRDAHYLHHRLGILALVANYGC